MFYSQFVLAKKGPLATIWIAAHLERKLRKAQVSGTSISVSVDTIIKSEVPIALRLSGHLLLGVVRIYSKKVGYLLHDCSEALATVKAAFAAAPAAGAGHVDLPGGGATVPFQAITLPEADLDFDDFGLLPAAPPPAFLSESFVDPNVSTREAITLEERPLPPDPFHGQWDSDERFGAAMEMPPLELEVASASQELQRQAGTADEPPPPSPPPMPEEGVDAGAVHADAAAGSTQLEPMDIDQDREGRASLAAAEEVVAAADAAARNGANALRDEEEYPEPEVLRSMATQEVGGEAPPFSLALGLNLDETPSTRGKLTSGGPEVDPTSARSTSGTAMALELPSPGGSVAGAGGAGVDDILPALPSPGAAELSPSAAAGEAPQRRRRPRRQHLVVDAVTFLSSEIMKRQLEDTSDIRRVRRRPPPLNAAAAGAAFAHISRHQGKGLTLDLFAAPSMPGLNVELVDFYQRVVAMPPADDLPLEALPTQETSREPVEPAQPMADGGGDTEPLSSSDGVPVVNQSVSQFPPMRPHPQPPPLAGMAGSPAGFYDGEPETVREIPAMELDAATEMVATPVAEPPEREQQAAHADDTLELDSEDRPRRDVDTVVNGSGTAEELLPGLDLEADLEASLGRQTLGRNEGERGEVPADEPATTRHPTEERPVAGLDFLGEGRGIDGLDADDALTEEEPNGATPSRIKDSGWSSRTRGVASYLQRAFKGLGLNDGSSDKAPAEVAPKLSLQGIVAGKSRRESARMFFETLVLKSKDYIEVEQAEAYGTVLVSARSKLMSVDF